MKMKKLTALALAGVLCLGMSTTAFAGPSVTPEIADQTIVDKDGNVVEDPDVDPYWVGESYKEFDAEVQKQVDKWVDDERVLALDMEEYAKKADPTITLDPKAEYAVVGHANPETTLDWEQLEDGQGLAVYFDVNNLQIGDKKKDTLKKGDKLYLLHWVAEKGKNGEWVLMETEIEEVHGKLQAKAVFNAEDKMSPVIFVAKVGSNGTIGGVTKPEDPTTPVLPVNPTDPSVNNGGKITVDDIAKAVVKQLQASNTKVVRVNTGVSPKTGE